MSDNENDDNSPYLRSIVMFQQYEDAIRMMLGVFMCVLGGKKGLS